MTHQSTPEGIATIDIDLGKTTFHLIAMDARGRIVLRRKVSRGQLQACLANLPVCLIGMEACAGAHHVGRQLAALGHDVRLLPAQYIKPFLKGHKNDYRDAEAIAEAVQRPTMRPVPLKSAEQLDLQSLHRVRSRLIGQRTAVINQIRGFLLECGIPVRKGPAGLREALPAILAQRTDVLSRRMIHPHRGSGRRLAPPRWSHRDAHPRHCGSGPPGCGLLPVDGHPRRRRDHRQRHGGGDRNRSRVHQGPRLCRLARVGAEADLNRRSHDTGRPVEAGEPLLADALRGRSASSSTAPASLAGTPLRPLAAGGRGSAASERTGCRPGQQTRPHRVECAVSRVPV